MVIILYIDHEWSKSRGLTVNIHSQLTHLQYKSHTPKAQEMGGREDKKVLRARGSERYCKTVPSINDRETIPLKSQQ